MEALRISKVLPELSDIRWGGKTQRRWGKSPLKVAADGPGVIIYGLPGGDGTIISGGAGAITLPGLWWFFFFGWWRQATTTGGAAMAMTWARRVVPVTTLGGCKRCYLLAEATRCRHFARCCVQTCLSSWFRVAVTPRWGARKRGKTRQNQSR